MSVTEQVKNESPWGAIKVLAEQIDKLHSLMATDTIPLKMLALQFQCGEKHIIAMCQEGNAKIIEVRGKKFVRRIDWVNLVS